MPGKREYTTKPQYPGIAPAVSSMTGHVAIAMPGYMDFSDVGSAKVDAKLHLVLKDSINTVANKPKINYNESGKSLTSDS